MKIEKAYSVEADEIIDAELAHEYYWNKKIRDKQKFECPSDNCDVSITCANMNKLRQNMKVEPYFRTVGEHHPDCHLLLETELKKIRTKKVNGTIQSRGKGSTNTDVFKTTRPESHFERKKKTTNKRVGVSPVKRNKNKTKSFVTQQRSPEHYSLVSFVSKYLKYKSLGITKQRYISINGYNVSYDKMFVEIAGNDVDDLDKYQRIYFGEAFINPRKDGDYNITFKESFKVGGSLIRPSVYMSEELLSKAFTKKLMPKKFKKISKKKYPSAWVFVYATAPDKTIGKDDKEYLNMHIDNMDFFDLRETI